MAISKIRRISSWTFIACVVVSIVVFALFYFGGDEEPYKGEYWTPTYTGLLLQWQYILFGLAVVAAAVLGLGQFISSFKTNPKGGVMGLIVLALFAAMLIITYTIGNGTPLPIMNEDAQVFNTPQWLKITDMWLYSTYTLIALIVIAIIGGSVKKIMDK